MINQASLQVGRSVNPSTTKSSIESTVKPAHDQPKSVKNKAKISLPWLEKYKVDILKYLIPALSTTSLVGEKMGSKPNEISNSIFRISTKLFTSFASFYIGDHIEKSEKVSSNNSQPGSVPSSDKPSHLIGPGPSPGHLIEIP